MVSKIDICNLALAHLGQDSILSLTQNDERARRLNLFYEPVKQEVLRTHNWAFAAAEDRLSLLEVREGALPFIYRYPADALYIRRIVRGEARPQTMAAPASAAGECTCLEGVSASGVASLAGVGAGYACSCEGSCPCQGGEAAVSVAGGATQSLAGMEGAFVQQIPGGTTQSLAGMEGAFVQQIPGGACSCLGSCTCQEAQRAVGAARGSCLSLPAQGDAYASSCYVASVGSARGESLPAGHFKEVYLQSGSMRALKSDVPHAVAEYTKNIHDEAAFDPAFVKCFSLALAADAAIALTADQALSRQILQKYTFSLEEARRTNMSEELTRRDFTSAFVEVR